MSKEQYLAALQEAWSGCRACGLCEERRNIVFGYGNPDATVMIIGEAPGEAEDATGYPFVGASGQLLDQFLGQVSAHQSIQDLLDDISDAKGRANMEMRAQLRHKLLYDYFLTNIVMCRPPENRDPIPKEWAACRTRLLEQIYTVDPVLIICAGRLAAEAVIGKKISITSSRGDIYDVDFPGRTTTIRYPVMPVLHPAYLMRKNDFKQKGGDGVKTYNDFVRSMNIIDLYNSNHFDIPVPTNRPKQES